MSYDVEDVIRTARQHGQDSDPGHEVGDLQTALRVAWSVMTPASRRKFLADQCVTEILTWNE